jgi:rod shape-determining protein MreD
MAFFRTQEAFSDRAAVMNNPLLRYIAYAVAALLLAVANVVLIPFIAIDGIVPDVMLIWAIWVALVEGQMIGMLAGFGAGVVFDIVAADVLGSNALAKVIAVFIAGYFYLETREEEMTGSFRFPLVLLLCGFIHNIIYYFFYLRPTEINFIAFFLRYGVFTTLYTAIIAVIPMLVISRRRE